MHVIQPFRLGLFCLLSLALSIEAFGVTTDEFNCQLDLLSDDIAKLSLQADIAVPRIPEVHKFLDEAVKVTGGEARFHLALKGKDIYVTLRMKHAVKVDAAGKIERAAQWVYLTGNAGTYDEEPFVYQMLHINPFVNESMSETAAWKFVPVDNNVPRFRFPKENLMIRCSDGTGRINGDILRLTCAHKRTLE